MRSEIYGRILQFLIFDDPVCTAWCSEQPDQEAKSIWGLARIDYVVLGILSLLLIPLYAKARLPFRMDLAGIMTAYWGGTAIAAIFVAVMLAVLGLPLNETLVPFVNRFRHSKMLMVVVALFALWMTFWFGLGPGLAATVDTLAVLELMARRKNEFRSAVAAVMMPALYLFCVIRLVFAYNHAIAGIEYAGTCDKVFERIDREILHIDVPSVVRWSLSHLPGWLIALLEVTYFALFRRIGAVLVITALLTNQRHAMQYVRSVLMAYLIATAVFYVVPAKGPYSTHPMLAPAGTPAAATAETQQVLAEKVKLLWAHQSGPGVAEINLADYFISFPSLHAALPLIALWFLRKWKRMLLILTCMYVLLLLPSTILLGWHYLIDIIGGVLDAALAIWIAEHATNAVRRTARSRAIKLEGELSPEAA